MAQVFDLISNNTAILPVSDGEYFTRSMPGELENGQCYLQFYSDAEATIPVTPSAGTITFSGSPISGQFLRDSQSETIQATAVEAGDASYTPPVFNGIVVQGKMSLNGITGAVSCRAFFWRY